MTDTSDSAVTLQLLTRIEAGDRSAFNQLFDRYRDRLRSAVQLRLDRRIQTRVDASDIVQETQLSAFSRLDDYLQRRPMPFGIWLRKTAQERICDQRRRHLQAARRTVKREQTIPEESSVLVAAQFLARGASPSFHLAQEEYRRLIAEAVNELDEIDAEILLMRHVEGLAHADIASVLGLKHDTVRQRYGRTLIKLQQLLVQKGLTERSL